MAPKLFLTGDVSIGKTTVIKKTLAGYKGPVQGFCSWRTAADGGEVTIWLAEAAHPENRRVVAQGQPGACFHRYPQVFDSFGAGILRRVSPAAGGLVLMDEIGFIEADAFVFQNEIHRVLALGLPVLGVLRQNKPTPFLDALFADERLTVLAVDAQNRDALPATCQALLGLDVR